MDTNQIVLLAVLQGLTEFLPISSSAHLILLPRIFGWTDQGLSFDVAVHVGTLSAVVGYFRHDLSSMARDWLWSLQYRKQRGDSRLAWGVLFGTLPVGLGGLLANRYGEDLLRSPLVIAAATVCFGLLLWWGDWRGSRHRNEHSLGWRDVFAIGLAQALALIPGTSRSGITMTAGLMLGLTRAAAARFSFLLSIPVILLAGLLKGYEAWHAHAAFDWQAMLGGIVISGVSAYLCIHYFLHLIERIGLLPFIAYRLALGLVLFVLFI